MKGKKLNNLQRTKTTRLCKGHSEEGSSKEKGATRYSSGCPGKDLELLQQVRGTPQDAEQVADMLTMISRIKWDQGKE